ncbi:hypothetical protein B2G94_09855 [Staphylococcus hominis subsp. hominis]|uniref:hypothetical protein n=1 Tax=Staphylococcus hominis TaxID=1290 RepID=UPI000B582D35|nr:hypothetical protein [Staphylococcus hominis]AUJ52628.1 hypothetical protein B7P03_08515 [Staphylococcus hominis subsp. hominis]OUL45141.1 hypothetical protein B2G94_09855 [Staphylococcus hominis subsp. hominis]
MNDKNQNDKWQDELFEILLDIDKVDVSAVYSHSRNYENTKNTERSPKEYSINISDIARYSLLKMDSKDANTIEKDIELLRKCNGKLNNNDMFIQEKNNFSANFKKFCNALGINSEHFKSGKSYIFKSKSLYVLYDILYNNSDYLHFFKNGVNKKDLDVTNRINENLYSFIKNEITNQQDYAHAMTVYYLYFLIDSNIEIGIKSKIIEILTATGITNNDRISLLEYYLDELEELDMEINAKLAESIETNQTSYLIQDDKTAIHFPLAKYITHRDTKASVPKNMLLSLILNSDLVPPEDLEDKELKYSKKITKEHHDKLVNEINKALNHYNDNDNPPSDYFYITSN